nr:DNA repair exonuclease [Saprospiraceae bacterium]
MSDFKFIHAADLHLDSPFKNILSLNPELGDVLRKSSVAAFHNLVDICIQEEIDFLLVSGDSFDSGSGSLAAQNIFIGGMRKLEDANIRVYIICGNHDPLSSWSRALKLPANVHRFESGSPQFQLFEKNGKPAAAIHGVSFKEREEKRNLAVQFSKKSGHPFSIAMLHGNLGQNTGHEPYCPFIAEDLRASEMDYWALGHIHKREVVLEGIPTAVYPGNLQGRHFNEPGEKGSYLVEVENQSVSNLYFKSLAPLIFHRKSIDLSNTHDLASFIVLLENLKLELEEEMPEHSHLIKAEFTGRTQLFQVLMDETELTELFGQLNESINYDQPFVYFDLPKNRTGPFIDLEQRKQSSDFLADLLNEFERLTGDKELLREILAEITAELSSHQSYKYIKKYLAEVEGENSYPTILESARQKCLSGLFAHEKKSQ